VTLLVCQRLRFIFSSLASAPSRDNLVSREGATEPHRPHPVLFKGLDPSVSSP
jgi:hypothetical protein